MADQLSISADFDRTLVWRGGDSARYLVVEVTAPPVEVTTSEPKPALNIALVIDASGSMSGAPLVAAKDAAIGVVNRLADGDTVSIVSFDDHVVTHVDGLVIDRRRRQDAERLISRIEPGGSTNLSGGWLQGAASVAAVMEHTPGLRNHIVLLSDGQANAGITQPEILEHHAAQLAARSLFTSTVGIGDHYSPTQLQAIAEYGGGRMYDAAVPSEIVEVVMAELSDVVATAAEEVTVAVDFPAGTRVECLSGFPSAARPGQIVARLGSLVGSATRIAVFKVTAPRGTAGESLPFAVVAGWKRPGTTDIQLLDPTGVGLTFARSAENAAQPRDLEVSLTVARMWQMAIVRRVTALNLERALSEAEQYIKGELAPFRSFCKGLPGAQTLVDELEHAARLSGRQWDARSSRAAMQSSREASYSMVSRLSTARPSWNQNLPPDPNAGNQPPPQPGSEQ